MALSRVRRLTYVESHLILILILLHGISISALYGTFRDTKRDIRTLRNIGGQFESKDTILERVRFTRRSCLPILPRYITRIRDLTREYYERSMNNWRRTMIPPCVSRPPPWLISSPLRVARAESRFLHPLALRAL